MNEYPLIDVRDVYKIYGEGQENEVRALAGVSMRIMPGEYVAVVGSSGSGKSTLMNILGCLDTPTHGEYWLDGEPVSYLSDGKLAHIRSNQIGFIFQGFNLLSSMTALENVELPLIYQGVGRRRRTELAMEALDRVGLIDRMEHKPSQMSGGQQQRAAIARALVTHPQIIMADEPTGNLDSRTGEHVMEILRGLHRDGTTVILITHDSEIARSARRTIRVADGLIVEDACNGEVTA